MRAALVVAIVVAAAPARADNWYGEQVLISDTASLGLLAGGLAARSAPLAATGAIGLVLAAPIVHLTHENIGRAGISLGMRAALPIFGVLVGFQDARSDHGLGDKGPVIGLVVGWAVASIVDIAVVARERGSEPAARMISFGRAF